MNTPANDEQMRDFTYSAEAVRQLWDAFYDNQSALDDLMLAFVCEAERLTDRQCIEHLQHGAARRVRVFKRTLQNVFALFPPETEAPLEADDLYDAQINLHAFVINLSGFFDNLAWAFVSRHGLNIRQNDISIFGKKVKRRLAQPLREFLSDEIGEWNSVYVNGYRDALAHRIPLYVPPSVIPNKDAPEYRRLYSEISTLVAAGKPFEAEPLAREQDKLARPCFQIMHSFSCPYASGAVYLHPQMNSDVATVIKAGNLFLAHWHELAPLPREPLTAAAFMQHCRNCS